MKSGVPQIIFKDEDQASGLAFMIHDLLSENVKSFRTRALVTSKLKGSVSLNTIDKKRAVSLTFNRGVVEIQDGIMAETPIMESSWKVFAAVASGLSSPVKSIMNKEMKIDLKPPYLSNVSLVLGTGFVLSVPKSFYENASSKDSTGINADSQVDTSIINNDEIAEMVSRRGLLKVLGVAAILFLICILVAKYVKFTLMNSKGSPIQSYKHQSSHMKRQFKIGWHKRCKYRGD